MQVPLTVIERDGRYLLIAGRHRLEALRVIGEERVPVRVVDFDDIEARLWSISENLHRTALTACDGRSRSRNRQADEGRMKERQAVDQTARPEPVEQYSDGRENAGAEQLGISAQAARK